MPKFSYLKKFQGCHGYPKRVNPKSLLIKNWFFYIYLIDALWLVKDKII